MSPVLWLFLGILVTFLITRGVTRYIRYRGSRPGVEAGGPIRDVVIGGVHLHHQVWGILLMFGSGTVLIGGTPEGAALDATAVFFGVGVSLTFDEFALWLHLEDVYWSESGRKSVDAMFCVLAIAGIFIGGVEFLTGSFLSAAWWGSVAGLLVQLAMSITALLKGKIVAGVVGIVLFPVSLIGALRLAKPDSWWARRYYSTRPKRRAGALNRFDADYERRWNRMRDLVAGAPTVAPVAASLASDRSAPDRSPVDGELAEPPS